MTRLFIALLISMFTVTTFTAHAANKSRSDLRKSHIAPIPKSKLKQTDDSFSDRPLTNKDYQIEARDTSQVTPLDSSSPKPTDVNYTPLPNLNDRNPISN